MQNKKIIHNKLLVSINLIILFLTPFILADVYVGTSEGYIYNTESQIVKGADVTGTAANCMVQCSQSTSSQSNGYYVIANLNLPKNEKISVYAEKFNTIYNRMEYGTAITNANEFQAAYANVIICLPPDAPVLIPESNTHNIDVELEWTSNPDFKKYSVYDEFQIDSDSIIRSESFGSKSEKITSLLFSSHTWKVRTCNSYCCSDWVSNTFNVGNSAPSPPILTNQSDVTPGDITFKWASGIDPDGDETYDEFCFGEIGETLDCETEITSPQIKSAPGCNYYTWKVRTCEKESEQLCSSWSEDGFISCGLECPSCVRNEISSTGGGNKNECISMIQTLAIKTPESIEKDANLPIKMSYSLTGSEKNLWFRIKSKDFIFNEYPLAELKNAKAKLEIIGKPKEKVKKGTYNLTAEIAKGDLILASESFSIEIREPLHIKIKRIFREVHFKNKKWIFLFLIILLIIILLSIYFYSKYQKNQ